jgi:hypothetical protein
MWEAIYEQLKEKGVPIEMGPRGIRVPITRESQEIIEQYQPKLHIGVIYHQVEHQNWYHIPVS